MYSLNKDIKMKKKIIFLNKLLKTCLKKGSQRGNLELKETPSSQTQSKCLHIKLRIE
jgi:hypothetical protein